MIQFKSVLKKFESKGEKTGWTYIEISKNRANKLNSGVRKAYRVKGKIDNTVIKALAIMPMGDGSFILPVKAVIRKQIKKKAGDEVQVYLEVDLKVDLSSKELLNCLKDEPTAEQFYFSLPISHQNYFSNYINSAKLQNTKEKRIVECIIALSQCMRFDEMLRARKKKNAF